MGPRYTHILAMLTALCAVAAVVTGALLTSANALPIMNLAIWKGLHRGLSTVAALGAITLAFSVTGSLRTWLIGSVLLAALPGGLLEAKKAPELAGLLHAISASIMTSICAVAALKLSWQGEPTTIPDEGSPSLKALARATWIGLLIQTALGAL